ncbi:MAG: amidohydrolase [Pontibacterium sp.]
MQTLNMQDLKVTLVQADLAWQQPALNRQHFESVFNQLEGKTDLIILPEMFTTGFTMAPESQAEPEQGETCQWLKEQAVKTGAAIMGSVVTACAEGYRNRLLFTTPEGEQWHYDKRHLFRMGGEHNHYQPGTERVIFEYQGWRILPQICYDLRFPVFSRNQNEYDLLVYVANWPEVRRNAWRTLLQARAIENLCYVAGVNRVGTDGSGLAYSGDSLLVGFKGDCLIDKAPSQVFTETFSLSYETLAQFREQFPAWRDADEFELKL